MIYDQWKLASPPEQPDEEEEEIQDPGDRFYNEADEKYQAMKEGD